MSLPALSVRRPITVLMATIAVCTFGWLALLELPVDLLPDLSYPTLTIQTVYRDAAPVSVEQFVTRPVEEAVGVIPGVREMRSISRAGLSEVILEFEWDEQMDFAALDVREKLGLVQLPEDVDIPRVLRFDPSLDPIVRLALSGARPLDELRTVADRWLKPRLESVRGVASARVRGGLEPEVVVSAREDRLSAYDLTLDDLSAAIQAENVNQPGGTLKDFNAVYLVRTLHEFDDLDQIRRTVVRQGDAGRVRVEDVADVTRGHRDREEITRLDGKEIVEIDLHREGSANTVAVATDIQAEIAHLRTELADDLDLSVMADQSRYISAAVHQVWSAALIGGFLAILVLYFFLRDLPSTLIIALSIPVSVIATFLPMQQAGVTLNIMSLGGLALGVGMLVDSSIVVLEAIDRRRRDGLGRAAAAAAGASEVAGAVVASTLTTVSVFFPIVFVSGIAGQLFYDQAVTVCLSLLASLAVALTLIPALAAIDFTAVRSGAFETLFPWDRAVGHERVPTEPRLLAAAGRFIRAGAGGSAGALRGLLVWPARAAVFCLWLLPAAVHGLATVLFPYVGSLRLAGVRLPPVGDGRHWFSRLLSVYLLPVRVLVFAGALLAATVWRGVTGGFQLATWPLARLMDGVSRAYPGMLSRALRYRWGVIAVAVALFALSMAALPGLGTSLVPDLVQGQFAFQLRFPAGTPLATTAAGVQRLEEALAGEPGVAHLFSLVGSLPSSASGRRTIGENLARLDLSLIDGADTGVEAKVIARVRAVLSLYPHIDADLVRPSVLTVKPPVAVRVFADDLHDLDTAATIVRDELASLPGVVDLAATAEPGNPEVRIELDRERAAALGVTPELVGTALRAKIRGNVIGEFREGEERLDIRLRAAEISRDRAADVAQLRVHLPGGGSVPVSAVADVEVDRGPAAIYRAGGARMAEISGRSRGANLGEVLARVRSRVASLRLPAGAQVGMAGQDAELQTSFASLKLMLALAIFLVYVVMAAQFESFLHPFIILLAVPLGAAGVVFALLLTHRGISVLVLIGVVMLAGIVVNNAIVLVDAINRRRRDGDASEAAIVAAGRERLRPILMTTITTVLALAPMALGLGAGDELRAPLAITVIGGLSVATLLTLLVIPCLYRAFSRDRAPTAVTGGSPAAAGSVPTGVT